MSCAALGSTMRAEIQIVTSGWPSHSVIMNKDIFKWEWKQLKEIEMQVLTWQDHGEETLSSCWNQGKHLYLAVSWCSEQVLVAWQSPVLPRSPGEGGWMCWDQSSREGSSTSVSFWLLVCKPHGIFGAPAVWKSNASFDFYSPFTAYHLKLHSGKQNLCTWWRMVLCYSFTFSWTALDVCSHNIREYLKYIADPLLVRRQQ